MMVKVGTFFAQNHSITNFISMLKTGNIGT